MVPRTEMIAVPADAPLEDDQLAIKLPAHQYPVYERAT
jgi:CBS domain containing-hemolysin-like protein